MISNLNTPVNRDALLDRLAAELALTAYRVALQSRTQGTWLDLELALWRALADTVETWGRDRSSPMTSTCAAGMAKVVGKGDSDNSSNSSSRSSVASRR
jgi:hypothetical protein